MQNTKVLDEMLKRIRMHAKCLLKCHTELWIWIMQCWCLEHDLNI